ncbi:MAG: transcriptional regulator [Deltaproteobacteria bacterium HGW-Deltaproteobacteria-18]|jgi:ArsR family transcriptional regulator|nr:MAG: transcriptional regulator [Deltaproteobacteria bacterium HGW-Deltaproteobacteria-18]
MNQDQTLAAICKALGHPARVTILKHLLQVDRCICGEIVNILPLAQSTVSQHLKQLKEAGLVRGEIEGPRICYCADKDRLAELKNLISSL